MGMRLQEEKQLNQFLCELYGTKRQVLVYNEKLEQVDDFPYPGTVAVVNKNWTRFFLF